MVAKCGHRSFDVAISSDGFRDSGASRSCSVDAATDEQSAVEHWRRRVDRGDCRSSTSWWGHCVGAARWRLEEWDGRGFIQRTDLDRGAHEPDEH